MAWNHPPNVWRGVIVFLGLFFQSLIRNYIFGFTSLKQLLGKLHSLLSQATSLLWSWMDWVVALWNSLWPTFAVYASASTRIWPSVPNLGVKCICRSSLLVSPSRNGSWRWSTRTALCQPLGFSIRMPVRQKISRDNFCLSTRHSMIRCSYYSDFPLPCFWTLVIPLFPPLFCILFAHRTLPHTHVDPCYLSATPPAPPLVPSV